MSDKETKSPEPAKDEVAKTVVTPKQKYYFPAYGKTVEADSTKEATEIVEKQLAAEKKEQSK